MSIFNRGPKPLKPDYSYQSTQYGNFESEGIIDNNIVPVDEEARTLITGGVSKTQQDEPDPFIGSFIQQDIAQSHHFKIKIDRIPIEFTSKAFGSFLPVKSISFDEVTFEHLTIPVGIFGDFPVMHRRKMGRFSLTLYDTADDKIEHALQDWENKCFPQGKYVSYLSEMVGTMKYASYSVEGKLNKELALLVIPADSHKISRSYDENSAKLITIGLVIVGVVGAITSGVSSSKGKGETLLSGDNVTPVNNNQSIRGDLGIG